MSLMKSPRKVQNLPKTNEIWELSTFLARTWITPRKEPPYRPHLSLISSSAGKIILSEIDKDIPHVTRYRQLLIQAMTRPILGGGRARRPQSVHLNNKDLVLTLAPFLVEFDIDCQYRVSLPFFNESRQILESDFNRGKNLPGLLSISGISPPLVGHLYELATDYHNAAPWLLWGDHDPLVISYPPNSNPRYGIVMGSMRETFGLAVYDTVEDLRLTFDRKISYQKVMQRASWLVLLFEEPTFMSFDDLDAVSQYRWSIAGENIYPFFGRAVPPDGLNLPTKEDLFWMEGALSGILHYLPKHQYKGSIRQYVDLIVPVTTLNGVSELRLQMPQLEHLLSK
jgi:Domain of unknown function (DUF6930)